jgi:two-component system sensor histidine kinase YesM
MMRKITRSLLFKFIFGFSLVMLPPIIFLLFNNYYANQVVREQISLTQKNYLSQQIIQQDKLLVETEKYINLLAERDPDILSFLLTEAPLDSSEYILAKQSVFNKLSRDLPYYSFIDGIFLFSKNDYIMSTYQNYYSKLSTIYYRFDDLTNRSRTKPDEWIVLFRSTEVILLKIAPLNDEWYAGVWLNLEQFIEPLSFTTKNQGYVSVVHNGGVIYSEPPMPSTLQVKIQKNTRQLQEADYITLEHHGERYWNIAHPSKEVKLQVVSTLPESHILERLPFFRIALYFIPLGIAIILIFLLFFLRNMLFNPMGRLIRGMRRVMMGDLETQLNENQSSNEFQFLMHTFNTMVDQIKHLKINVYEEELRAKNAEFKHLQVQINPHFYLNSLNIIYSLAATGKTDLVQQMAIYLAQYFRFTVRTNQDFITLEEEMNHIQNYLGIQGLRFPNKFSFELKVDDDIKSCCIPPLTIQTFVENCIVHGFKQTKQTFQIKVEAQIAANRQIIITIKDNGVGFSDTILDELNQIDQAQTFNNDHGGIGIWNVMYRLKHKYGEATAVHFSNESGALVTIHIPAVFHNDF